MTSTHRRISGSGDADDSQGGAWVRTEEAALLVETARALSSVVGSQEALLGGYARIGEERAFDTAEKNQMVPMLAHSLRDCEVSRSAVWDARHAESSARITGFMGAMDEIAASLADAGIPIVALKNAGIARAIHSCLGCCPMGDIDLLVRPEDFSGACRIVEGMGAAPGSRSPLYEASPDGALAAGGAEFAFPMEKGESLWVEMQFRPVSGRWIRPDQEPPAGELFTRARPVEGSAVHILSPEDNLLQVCLHTAKHTYFRAPGFRLHLDVDRIVRSTPPDWERFLVFVETLQVKVPAYYSLLVPALLFDTPIPGWLIKRIEPGPVRRHLQTSWLTRMGLFEPRKEQVKNWQYVLFVASLYDTPTGLVRAAFPLNTSAADAHRVIRFSTFRRHVQRLYTLATKRTI